MPARVADDARRPAGAGDPVVVNAVQVAVQPDVGERQQVVVGVAEARGAALLELLVSNITDYAIFALDAHYLETAAATSERMYARLRQEAGARRMRLEVPIRLVHRLPDA